jgi:hypothetical protein
MGENLYVDGDFSAGYAVEFLKAKGAEVVIGLRCPAHHEIINGEISLVERIIDPIRISNQKILKLDLALHPVDLLIEFDVQSSLLDYRKNRELMQAGYEATQSYMNQIKGLLI